jgi:hypothetical protein
MARTDLTKSLNKQIGTFVEQSANRRLLAGTGHYSTLFRGGLFEEVGSAAVSERLATRRVDALWLGSNPCVRRSLQYIMRPPRGRGDYPDFERQLYSGLFGSARWDASGAASPDFNPLERPKGNWRVYRDLLARVGNVQNVAMANVVPWGSQSIDAFIAGVSARDRGLLARALAFADDLNIQVVRALRPRIIVVPLSLGRNRSVSRVGSLAGLTLKHAKDVEAHTLRLANGRFNYFSGLCSRGNLTVPTLFLRHPASLRLARGESGRIVDAVARVLEKS